MDTVGSTKAEKDNSCWGFAEGILLYWHSINNAEKLTSLSAAFIMTYWSWISELTEPQNINPYVITVLLYFVESQSTYFALNE